MLPPATPVRKLQRWLFQTRGPEPSPVMLGQRRVFIVPSRTGFFYALVIGVMYLGAVNYNLGLGHALVFLLISLGFTGMVHAFRNLAGLQIRAGRASPVFSGETAEFEIIIDNPHRDPRPALTIAFAEGPARHVNAAAEASTPARIPLVARRRGWLHPGRITLESRYPLGLFRTWSYPHPDLRCLVYPAPLPRPLPPLMPGEAAATAGGETGDEDFAGLRLRTPADPLRHVAWKAFARGADSSPLLVKRFAGGRQPELHLDWHALPESADIETRLSILAGWVLSSRSEGLRYTLSLPNRRLGPDSGERFADTCLEALALHGADDASTVASA